MTTTRTGPRLTAAIALLIVLSPRAFSALTLTSPGVPVTQTFGTTAAMSLAGFDSNGWRVSPADGNPSYASGSNTVTRAPTLLASSPSAGSYNFSTVGSSTDRALGFVLGSTGQSRSVFVQLANTTGLTLTTLQIGWDFEQYTNGRAPLDLSFHHGYDGETWTAAPEVGASYGAVLDNDLLPATSAQARSLTLSGLSVPTSGAYFLRWVWTLGDGTGNGAAVGLDNVTVVGSVAHLPELSSGVLLAIVALAAAGISAIQAGARRCRPGAADGSSRP